MLCAKKLLSVFRVPGYVDDRAKKHNNTGHLALRFGFRFVEALLHFFPQ